MRWLSNDCPLGSLLHESGYAIVLTGPITGRIVVLGTSAEVVTVLRDLLQGIGQIEQATVERVFSPEEELFQPYFSLMALAFGQLINDPRIKPLLKQAFTYFNEKDYIHCVANLGLVAEDYLTQVFETYLRLPCPKGLTLGQMYDQLHAAVKELFTPEKQELRQLDGVYEQITQLESSTGGQGQPAIVPTVAILREILNSLRSDRKHFSHRIDELHRRDQRLTVFPTRIRENLTELIRNRNAASHKTRVPLGEYEALRTLYCLTSFLLWWRREKELIDWSLDRRPILELAISRNSTN